VQDARRLQREGFPGEGGYAGISGKYRHPPMADEIEAGAVVMSVARRAVVVAVKLGIRCGQRSVRATCIGVLRVAGCLVVLAEGVAVDANHRRQQKGQRACCGYASC
jgi:hypothetical protein